eukprot:GGOE01002077.1.p1 GENE.GGOE01002077.1~~GGOE01002077.1.p1  ORF type:complete len:192 (-),score=5.72 GGOE01002077.1:79-654(-)
MNLFIGNFDGFTIVVDNPIEASWLHSHGYFGKGSLSRSRPVHCDSIANASSKWHHLWTLPHHMWNWVANFFSSQRRGVKRNCFGAPKSVSQSQGSIHHEHPEVLVLLPEEAFYLSLSGALQVRRNGGEFMSLDLMWEVFNATSSCDRVCGSKNEIGSQLPAKEVICPASSFFTRFKVYQHFRSRFDGGAQP